MKYLFEKTVTSYAIEIEDEDDFLALMDSESYATDHAAFKDGNDTLCAKLGRLDGVSGLEYNGHFGSFIYLDIDVENDRIGTKKEISRTITEHLEWCRTLEIVDHVKKRRENGGY